MRKLNKVILTFAGFDDLASLVAYQPLFNYAVMDLELKIHSKIDIDLYTYLLQILNVFKGNM